MLWGDGTTYNTISHNKIWGLGRDGVVIWGAEWNLYEDSEGRYRALPPLDAKGNVIAYKEVDGAPNWNIAIGFVSGTEEAPIVARYNRVNSGSQGIMATGMSMYVYISHNIIHVENQGILIWGEWNRVHHNNVRVNGEVWAGINVKLSWWLFYDPSTNNFISRNTCNNLGIVTYYDQNSPGANTWLMNHAPGTGWEDPHYG